MKCFMHPKQEATAVCKKCGKAMCIDCSSYTGHSGICPACKKEEYEIELNQLNTKFKKNTTSLILNSVLLVVWTIVSIILIVKSGAVTALLLCLDIVFCGIMIKRILQRKPIKERIDYLTCEISKINLALTQGKRLI